MNKINNRGHIELHFSDKFSLSEQENSILAQNITSEVVYCGMKMEQRAVTLLQVQTILNGTNVPEVRIDDLKAILNMRDAWKFLLNTVSEPVSFEYWCKLNEYIARNEALEWGKLRTGSVGISGTDYEPPVPNKDKTVAELEAILTDADASTTDKALAAFTWGARGQFFWDGNKRTSLMLANKILILGGAGIMTITDKYMEQFNGLLLDFYNTGESEALKEFLYNNAIQGITV